MMFLSLLIGTSYKGLLVAKTLDGCLKDGITVLLVLVGDVVNGASDFLHPA